MAGDGCVIGGEGKFKGEGRGRGLGQKRGWQLQRQPGHSLWSGLWSMVYGL